MSTTLIARAARCVLFRVGLATILAIFLTLPPARAELDVVGARTTGEATAVRKMAAALDSWIDAYSAYPPAPGPGPRIVLVAPGAMASISAHARHFGRLTRGAYDPATGTIYLQRPWTASNVQDRGVLLHELIHHRQVHARHWICSQAMEWDAYKLQQTFVAEGGEDLRVNWIAVVLDSSCAPRDHHPD